MQITPLLAISCYSNSNPSTHYPGYTVILSMVYAFMKLTRGKEEDRPFMFEMAEKEKTLTSGNCSCT